MSSAEVNRAKPAKWSIAKGAARNVLSNWITYLLSAVVSLFLSPFVVRHLGNSAYGIWVLLVSLTGYLGFLDLGIRGAVTRYIAKFHSEESHEKSSSTVSSACGLFVAAGFLAIGASVIFAVFALPHFNVPPAYSSTARLVIIIAGTNVAVSLSSGVFGGVLVGLQRFDVHNGIAIAGTALRTTSIVLALSSGRGLLALALIQLSCSILELLLGFALSRTLYPEMRLDFTQFQWAYVSLIFSFGFYAFLLLVSNYLEYYTDALVIGSLMPVGMVTFFAIASNLTISAKELVGGFSRIMTPLASQMEVQSADSKLAETSLKAARYCAMAVLPIFITFLIRGQSFIGLWMGPAYADLSGHVLRVLSLPWLFGVCVAVFTSVMLGTSRHKPLVPIALAEGVTNLILSIVLAKRIGVIGVAWGTAIPSMAVSVLFWPWYVRRTLGISFAKYVTSLWLLPMFALLPFAAFSYTLDRFIPAPNLLVFFLQVALTLPLAVLGSWYLGLTRDERTMYSEGLISRIRFASTKQ